MKPVILHVVAQMKIGGLEKGIKNIVTKLTNFQHVILVLEQIDLKWIANLPNTVIVVGLNRQPGSLFWTYRKILYWMNQFQPDLIHTRNLSTIECQILAVFSRIQARIHSEHGRDSSDLFGLCKKRQRWRKIFSHFIHHYITVSEELSHYLQSSIHIAKKRITVIPNGVDTPTYFPILKDETVLRIGMVMRLVNNKQPQHCLEALAQLKHLPIHCDIVGSGPEMEKIKQTIVSFSLQSKVTLLDKQYDLTQFYNKWHVVVLPSQFEGCSNVLLEAMSAGLVVIASDIPGNQAIIHSGDNGLLYPLGKVEVLKKYLENCFFSKEYRFSLGSKAKETIEKNFSLSVMLKNYERCYKELLCVA
jgi:sugar transferase (PEP-CTERM/EpsH1 system associated)